MTDQFSARTIAGSWLETARLRTRLALLLYPCCKRELGLAARARIEAKRWLAMGGCKVQGYVS